MRRRSFVITFFLIASFSFAQNEQDALRYSFNTFGGSARFMAMGGAFGAIGADLSVNNINPAGLGMYHKNEFTFTPSFYSQKANAMYNGTSTDDVRFNMRIDNCGLLFGSRTTNTKEKGWQNLAMGITYDRLASFQSNQTMTGVSTTSMMDSWRLGSNGKTPDQLNAYYEQLAYNVWLLDLVPLTTNQYKDTIRTGDSLTQLMTIKKRGGMSEWTFGLGGNYSDQLYIGASIGIPQVKYAEDDYYTESELHDSISAFDSYEFSNNLSTVGKGFALHVGMIYRPVDLVRIGISWRSPCVLKLSDAYNASMTSYFTNGAQTDMHTWDADPGTFSYRIVTPMRTTASCVFVLGRIAMISSDVEIVDYSDASIKSTTYAFIDANKAIQDKYTMGINTHAGVEVRLLPFVVRAGFANYSSPYQPTVNNTAAKRYYTFGGGYRSKDDTFFGDLAFVINTEKSNYYFYDQSLCNPVANTFHSIDIALTVGFRY